MNAQMPHKLPTREPNGRLSRMLIKELEGVAPAEAKRMRDMAARSARDAVWGTQVGILYAEGRLTAVEFEAGKRWGTLTVLYLKAIGARPPHPPAVTLSDLVSLSDPVSRSALPPASTADRERIEAWLSAYENLQAAGRGVLAAVRRTCEANEQTVGMSGIHDLRYGLQRLAYFWGLTTTPARVSLLP